MAWRPTGRPNRRRWPIRAVATVAAMVIAGCGSDSGTPAAQPTTPTTPTTVAPPTAAPAAVDTTTTAPASTTTQAPVPSTESAGSAAGPATRYLDPAFQVDLQRDVIYASAPAPDGSGKTVDLRLDLYTPRGDTESDRPVFIYSHGGGFSGGDKMEGVEWATQMAELGYVAASIEYRLGPLPTVTLPLDEQEQAQVDRARSDLQAAVRWFRANAAALGVDADRIGVGGYSAGAIMSAATAVRSSLAESQPPGSTVSNPEFSSAVCGAVSIAGAVNPAFVDADDAGVIFHHGTLDDTVPIAIAAVARDALIEAGLPVEWYEYPDEGHAFRPAARDSIIATSIQWLYDHVATAQYPCSPAVAAGAPAP